MTPYRHPGLCRDHWLSEEGSGPGWARVCSFGSASARARGRRCPWSGLLLVAVHKPHCLFSLSPSSSPALSLGTRVLGAAARLRPALHPTGLPSLLGPGGGQAVGTWEGGGKWAVRGLLAVCYSHYQPAVRAGPWPLWLPSHLRSCLLTQGCPPQGGRCRLGNEGVQGPPKQPAAGPLRNPERTSGVGVQGCKSPPWEAHGKGRSCVPGKAREDRGSRTGPSLQEPRVSLPRHCSSPAQGLVHDREAL